MTTLKNSGLDPIVLAYRRDCFPFKPGPWRVGTRNAGEVRGGSGGTSRVDEQREEQRKGRLQGLEGHEGRRAKRGGTWMD